MIALLLLFLALDADPFVAHGEKALVLLFIRTDCPISNRYAPEIQHLYKTYEPQGVDFRLVYPERDLAVAAIAKHRLEYGYSIPALPDANHRYVARAKIRATPEAAVFVHGELVYRGRIDDRYIDFGKFRSDASKHDLDEVLAAVVAGKAMRFRETKAIGCAIEDRR
jgi:thiol-disulfide isomerase/thioredoxin